MTDCIFMFSKDEGRRKEVEDTEEEEAWREGEGDEKTEEREKMGGNRGKNYEGKHLKEI